MYSPSKRIATFLISSHQIKQIAMFVLQKCSICYEDYDANLTPHIISCGHIFCRSCLDSLVSPSPRCPYCRTPFSRAKIHKVICPIQDPPTPSAKAISEEETIMWQAISSSVDSSSEHESRKLIVQNNSNLAMEEAGFSANLLTALDTMRLLVEVESTNLGLSRSMDAASVVEKSLRDQISLLEMQLSIYRRSAEEAKRAEEEVTTDQAGAIHKAQTKAMEEQREAALAKRMIEEEVEQRRAERRTQGKAATKRETPLEARRREQEASLARLRLAEQTDRRRAQPRAQVTATASTSSSRPTGGGGLRQRYTLAAVSDNFLLGSGLPVPAPTSVGNRRVPPTRRVAETLARARGTAPIAAEGSQSVQTQAGRTYSQSGRMGTVIRTQ
ncbi:hypothetical protein BDV93DRAFT_545742 [Ceratobasidium sp. AG-I]|nr:hypothetical protein BDV93DRAFT_545742 [Ceratobasidium sp. AG-I]